MKYMLIVGVLVILQQCLVECRCFGADVDDESKWPGHVRNVTAKCVKNYLNQTEVIVKWKEPLQKANVTVTGYQIAYYLEGGFGQFLCGHTKQGIHQFVIRRGLLPAKRVEIGVIARPSFPGLLTPLVTVKIC